MNSSQTENTRGYLWKPFVALGALSALTLALTFGCSDSSPTGSNKKIGNTTDSSFQFVSNQFSPTQTDASGLDWIDVLMGQLPGFTTNSNSGTRPFLGRGLAPAGGDTVIVVSATFVIDTVSKWITFDATIASFPDTFVVVDSMRFRDASNTPFIPQGSLVFDSLSGVDIRVHGSATVTDTTDFVGTGRLHSSLSADIIGRDTTGGLDTVQINSTETDTLSGTAYDSANGQCVVNVTMTTLLTNVVGLIDDSTGSCPLSGQAKVTATISADCSGDGGTLVFNDGWTITATFNNGADATVVFENSTTRWETTGPCNDSPSQGAGPLHRMAGLAKATIE